MSRSVIIDAPAERIFAFLADPRRHADFDGSGTVQGNLKAPATLALGEKFGMKMRLGIPYTITNEVVEFEPDRRIAWRHFGKHIWRYVLTPAEGGGTTVTETFDWETSRGPRLLELLKYPQKNAVGIEKSLVRLKALAESG